MPIDAIRLSDKDNVGVAIHDIAAEVLDAIVFGPVIDDGPVEIGVFDNAAEVVFAE
jgi:hypothetical protein